MKKLIALDILDPSLSYEMEPDVDYIGTSFRHTRFILVSHMNTVKEVIPPTYESTKFYAWIREMIG